MVGVVDGQNIALVPGTTDAVSIANINPTQNSAYYRNNVANTNGYPVDAALNSKLALDGLTTVLRASVNVGPGTHTMKFAIADTGDARIDSAVLLQGGSFSNVAQYPVSATVIAGNGSVSCSPTSVAAGGSSACTAVPANGYQVLNWTGACASAGSNAHCTLSNIQADQNSTVSFVVIPPTSYSVSATVSGGNGAVSCAPASVTAGGSSACTAAPDPGYQVESWSGACAGAGTNVHCTLDNIQATQSSTVTFSALPPASYHVSASVVGGNGSVTCTPTTVTKGGNSTCTAVPAAGYQVQSWSGACASWGSQAQCYLTKIRADQSATVSFAPIPPATYTVSATVTGGNGHASCSPSSITAGANSTCTAVADAGYQVQSWSGACASAGSAAQCDLTNIQSNQSASVSFVALPVATFTVSANVDGGNGTVSCAPSRCPRATAAVAMPCPMPAIRSRPGPAPAPPLAMSCIAP